MRIAQAQLAERYHLPQFPQVKSIETLFRTHYWTVGTDKGPCEFVFNADFRGVEIVTLFREDAGFSRDFEPDHAFLSFSIGRSKKGTGS